MYVRGVQSTSPRTLYVGGLGATADAVNLKQAFGEFGEIAELRLVRRSGTGECRGFGYITYACENSAVRALTALNGKTINGWSLRVDFAR